MVCTRCVHNEGGKRERKQFFRFPVKINPGRFYDIQNPLVNSLADTKPRALPPDSCFVLMV